MNYKISNESTNCNDIIFPVLDSHHSEDMFAWLEMFGIFLASLAVLALLTLLTCKRPKSPREVDRLCAPVFILQPELPPCYQSIIEDEKKDLPSYLDVLHYNHIT